MQNDIIDKISEELNLPKEVIENTYKAYWGFIKSSIEALPLKEKIEQEDYNTLKTSINIPSLGKISCTYNRYLGIHSRFDIINKIRSKQ